jgi:hypothetical protein
MYGRMALKNSLGAFCVSRQNCQDAAFLLTFVGIFCISVASIHLTFRVNALEKALKQQRQRQQPQQSSPPPKSTTQSGACGHSTLGTTLAVGARLTDHVWTVEELVTCDPSFRNNLTDTTRVSVLF